MRLVTTVSSGRGFKVVTGTPADGQSDSKVSNGSNEYWVDERAINGSGTTATFKMEQTMAVEWC